MIFKSNYTRYHRIPIENRSKLTRYELKTLISQLEVELSSAKDNFCENPSQYNIFCIRYIQTQLNYALQRININKCQISKKEPQSIKQFMHRVYTDIYTWLSNFTKF